MLSGPQKRDEVFGDDAARDGLGFFLWFLETPVGCGRGSRRPVDGLREAGGERARGEEEKASLSRRRAKLEAECNS